ncbi:MAG: ABC transporter permease [Myxococcales bacterium]|nr:ABC transporter permease [Myxococcales bacterium]
MSMGNLKSNKMRSLLTMLGIIIGVGAVIAMISIADGAKQSVSGRIKAMGTNLLVVRPGQHRFRHVRGGTVETLVLEDCEAIRRQIVGVELVSPELASSQQLKYFNQNTNTVVLGVHPEYLSVNNFAVKDGRFITDEDNHNYRKVVVIGATVARDLFMGRVPIGEEIKIKGMLFQIIGTLEAKGNQGWMDPDDQVLIPLSVAQKRVQGVKYLRAINIRVENEDEMGNVQAEIEQLLRRRHRIQAGQDADFNIRNQKEILDTLGEITGTLTLLLASIAGVSLVVGGIGIMNIMLVSVTERTREIGVRKALGAKNMDIMFQFLVESVMLCLFGGALGVAFGVTASEVIAHFAKWQAIIAPSAVMISFAFAVFVGLFFGLYPARRAATLNPIDALRYE